MALADSQRDSILTLTGNLNPLILQPHWLLAQNLVGEADYSAAVGTLTQFLTPDYVRGEYPQLRFDAFRNELVVSTVQTTQAPVLTRDFLVGVLQSLPHTPVEEIEITHTVHSAVEDLAGTLERFVGMAALRSVLGEASVEGFTIASARGHDGGTVRLSVETSGIERYDLYVGVSVGFEMPEGAKDDSASWAVDVLNDRWQETLDLASSLINVVFSVDG